MKPWLGQLFIGPEGRAAERDMDSQLPDGDTYAKKLAAWRIRLGVWSGKFAAWNGEDVLSHPPVPPQPPPILDEVLTAGGRAAAAGAARAAEGLLLQRAEAEAVHH